MKQARRLEPMSLTNLYVLAGGLFDQADRAIDDGDLSDLVERCRLTLMSTPHRDHARLLAVLVWSTACAMSGAERVELANQLINDPLLGGWNTPAAEEAS